MTHKEVIAALEEKVEWDRHFAAENELRMLAFVVDRFCGGKIEFSVEEISSVFYDIDILRTCQNGKITYATRRRQDERI